MIEIGDEVEWEGRMRKVTTLLAISVALDGVEDAIGLPVDVVDSGGGGRAQPSRR
jgi:hypothetical protein